MVAQGSDSPEVSVVGLNETPPTTEPVKLITRRRFPLRRYSFQEDGSLVVKEKHTNRDP